MNSSVKSWAIGCAVVAMGLVSLPAQDAPAAPVPAAIVRPPTLVRVQLEFIDVPHSALTRLMAVPRQDADDAALRKSVADLIEKGEGSILETAICSTKSGEKAAVESIREFIYPTEYEPGEISMEKLLTDSPQEPLKQTLEYRPPLPTAFETRNLGTTIEITPVVSGDGKTVEVKMAPELSYHIQNETWIEWKDERGDSSVKMPSLFSLRLNSAVILEPGKPQMIAALSPKGADGTPDRGRKIMVFVRCEVLEPGR